MALITGLDHVGGGGGGLRALMMPHAGDGPSPSDAGEPALAFLALGVTVLDVLFFTGVASALALACASVTVTTNK